MNNSNEPLTGKILNERWNVLAKHALFSKDGKWYHRLTDFPGAFFDCRGFLLFETKDDYLNNPYLEINEEVNIPTGISFIPGYVVMEDNDEDYERYSDDISYESGSIYPYDMPEEVDIREEPHAILDWMRKLERGKLIIDPEFQRHLVWSPKQKSQFIESVILGIPLPPLFVNQTREGKLIIVDGLQRTSTLSQYTNDEFPLSHLLVLSNINGFTFSKLNEQLQTRIEDKKLLIYVIKPSVPPKMVYDIFHRINTGGTQLTQQEIRNCFYLGPATRLLKELSETEYFVRAIDWGISPKRMKDREAILRYISFKILDFKIDYKNDMDAFLGLALEKINKMSIIQLQDIRDDFERIMKLTFSLFGLNNFRIPTLTTRGRINIALMESICYAISLRSDSEVQSNKQKILINYSELINNPNYIDAIQFATGDRKRVLMRFELAQKILGNI